MSVLLFFNSFNWGLSLKISWLADRGIHLAVIHNLSSNSFKLFKNAFVSLELSSFHD
jgi:hypothetical protein